MVRLVAVIRWYHLQHGRTPMYNGIEPMDGMCGILDGTRRAVGLHQAVAALHDASLSRLVLALGIAGQGVLDSVAEAVLRVGVGIQGHVVRMTTAGGAGEERQECHHLQNQ
jgi:hypothetical protein